MNSLTKLGLIALVTATAVFSGCTKTPKNITPIPGGGGPAAPGGEVPTVSTKPFRPTSGPQLPSNGGPIPVDNSTTSNPLGSNTQTGLPPGDQFGNGKVEDPATLSADTVYFDYDKSAIKSGEVSKITAVADYLKGHPQADLKVEGHCDERGTEEYNRALGERRALSIRERLVNAGISGDRITTVSFGEERPADPGHDEAAWAKNRRGEFVLLLPPGLK